MRVPAIRSVWSFWSKPFYAHYRSVWKSEKHHLLAWVLSVETDRKHYPETALYSDDEGARMLVDGIGIEFDHVSTELNALRSQDPDWWVLGKLYAYRAQNRPFVHIDNDAFLWKPLPGNMICATVFAQNSESFPFDGGSWYRPRVYDRNIKGNNGWLPPEWEWYVSVKGNQALSCGIFGGNQVDFISHYADNAIRILEHPKNKPAWLLVDNRIADNILFEQYYLSACTAYYTRKDTCTYPGLDVQYLFESWPDALNPNRARQVGYTHLIGGAKRNEKWLKRLEERVARDYPAQYERCMRYVKKLGLRA